MVKKNNKKKKTPTVKARLERVALNATRWIGSIESLIAHTLAFFFAFVLVLFGIPFDRVLLVLTTVLSLEAIYLAIFIQMTVNQNTLQLAEVEKNIDEIQEDVEDIAEDVEEIQGDVEDIAEDVESIEKDIDEIEKDIDEIQEDVEDITEDIEELQEEDSQKNNTQEEK